MIQSSEFFQYSFVLILKRKCLVLASRVRSGESGTPSTIIYVRWSSRRTWVWHSCAANKSQAVPFFDALSCNKITAHGWVWNTLETHQN